ncbi:MAG: hypothetical protein ACE5FN_06640 [Leptospirillia bacterium]
MSIKRLVLTIGAFCCWVGFAVPASGAGIHVVNPVLKSAKSAKHVTREHEWELLSRLAGFVTDRIDLRVGKTPVMGIDKARKVGGVGDIEATFALSPPVLNSAGGPAVKPKLPTSHLSVSRDRIRLMFKLRW